MNIKWCIGAELEPITKVVFIFRYFQSFQDWPIDLGATSKMKFALLILVTLGFLCGLGKGY